MPTTDAVAIEPPPDAMLVSISGAAALLGLSRTEVYSLLTQGRLTSRYHGRRRLVDMDSVRAFVAGLPTERVEG